MSGRIRPLTAPSGHWGAMRPARVGIPYQPPGDPFGTNHSADVGLKPRDGRTFTSQAAWAQLAEVSYRLLAIHGTKPPDAPPTPSPLPIPVGPAAWIVEKVSVTGVICDGDVDRHFGR